MPAYTRRTPRSAVHRARQLAALGREQPRGPSTSRHYLTNHVIEPFAGQAIGKQYLVVIDLPEPAARAKGVPGTIFLGGHYEDCLSADA